MNKYLLILLPFYLGAENFKTSDEEKKAFSEVCGHLMWQAATGADLYSEPVDTDAVIQGYKNASEGLSHNMTEEQFNDYILKTRRNNFNRLAEEHLKQSEELLTKIASEKDSLELIKNKLYVKIIEEGQGLELKTTDTAIFKITASTQGSEPFYSNKDGASQELELAIEGFKKGVVGMKPGEKRILYIHPELGYGKIIYKRPNMALIVDVELVSIEKNS